MNVRRDVVCCIGLVMTVAAVTALSFSGWRSAQDDGFMSRAGASPVAYAPSGAMHAVNARAATMDESSRNDDAPAHVLPVQGGVGACCMQVLVPCAEDFDGDGAVGLSDLIILINTWGPCPGCPQDLDGDGVVGLSDLILLINAWGPCPGQVEPGCAQRTENQCANEGGVFLGEGILCDNVLCDPVPAALSFYQVDFLHFEGGGVFLSNWGSLVLTYETGPTVRFINLALASNPGEPDPSWQIQNMPLHSSDPPGEIRRVRFYFDLGNAVGEDVTGIDYGATVTELPENEPPINRQSAVDTFEYSVRPGQHETLVFEFRDPEPLIFPVPIVLDGWDPDDPFPDDHEHQNRNMPNQPQGHNECVPGAVSNSLQFLNREHGMNMPESAIDMDAMKDAVGWAPDGAEPAPKWSGWKDTFMQEQGYQIITQVVDIGDMAKVRQALDKDFDVEIDMAWIQTNPDGQEKEIGAHAAVVTGVTSSKDGNTHAITYIDDLQQDVPNRANPEEVIYDSTTGRMTGAPAGARVRTFTIERPGEQNEKSCRQVVTSLEWIREYLEAVPGIMDWLLENKGADPAEINERRNEAKGNLERAEKLREKAAKVIQGIIDNGGLENCPPISALQEIIDTLNSMEQQIEDAISAIDAVIQNPDMPQVEKDAKYNEAKNKSSSAAGAATGVLQGRFGCLRLARELQRARRVLEIAQGMADRAIGYANQQGQDGVPSIATIQDFLQDRINDALARINHVRDKIQQIIEGDKVAQDCPSAEDLQTLLKQLNAIRAQLMQAKNNLQQIPEMTPAQQKNAYAALRDLLANARNALNPIIDELLTPPPPPPPGCGVKGTGDCCEANGSPYCDNQACCKLICKLDPFCCNTDWDGICADQAQNEPICECDVSPSGCCFGAFCIDDFPQDLCLAEGGIPIEGSCEDVKCPGGPAGACADACGTVSPEGCWCDQACAHLGDCCAGACDDCPGTCCPWDVNGDGVVGTEDQLICLDQFGPCPPSGPCPCDFNRDGIVNNNDIAILLNYWGSCLE